MGSDESIHLLAEEQRRTIEDLQHAAFDLRKRIAELEGELRARALAVNVLLAIRAQHRRTIAELERVVRASEEAIAALQERVEQEREAMEAVERAYRAQALEFENLYVKFAARFLESSEVSVLLHRALERVMSIPDATPISAAKPAVQAALDEAMARMDALSDALSRGDWGPYNNDPN